MHKSYEAAFQFALADVPVNRVEKSLVAKAGYEVGSWLYTGRCAFEDDLVERGAIWEGGYAAVFDATCWFHACLSLGTAKPGIEGRL